MIDREKGENLYDEDCLYLFKKTIPQLMLSTIEGVCVSCGKNTTSESPLMNCGCKYCQKCLEEKVKSLTDGKIILNNFEKGIYLIYILAYSKIDSLKCKCGSNFDTDWAIQNFIKDIQVYNQKAQERLSEQAITYCINCRINTNKIKEPGGFQKLPVIPEQDAEVVNSEHVICKSCILTIRGDILTMSRKGEINSSTRHYTIKCSVCIEKPKKIDSRVSKGEEINQSKNYRQKKGHKIEMKVLKVLMKSEAGCCCVL